MDDRATGQGGPQRAVQPVFEVVVAPPLHYVAKDVAVKRGVLGEQRVQVELDPGGVHVFEPEHPRRKVSPVLGSLQLMSRVGAPLAHALKDHGVESKGPSQDR